MKDGSRNNSSGDQRQVEQIPCCYIGVPHARNKLAETPRGNRVGSIGQGPRMSCWHRTDLMKTCCESVQIAPSNTAQAGTLSSERIQRMYWLSSA